MPPPKHIVRIVLAAVVVYAVLMAPWPGLQRGYAAAFRAAGNVMFARFWFWPQAGVRFLDLTNLKAGDLAPGAPEIEATGTFDTLMELRNQQAPGTVGYLRTSSRYVGYSPTVVTLALLVATPLAWRKRLVAVLVGLAAIHVFIAGRLTLTLLAGGFARPEKAFAVFRPGETMYGALSGLDTVVADNPTVSFVVPALIWFVIALWSGALRGGLPSDREPGESGAPADRAWARKRRTTD